MRATDSGALRGKLVSTGQRASVLVIVALLLASGCSDSSVPEPAQMRSTSQPVGLAPDEHCTFTTFAGHSYWFCADAKGFQDARDRCKAASMDLATVDDDAENEFVQSNLQRESFVGLSDRTREGVWKWSADGRPAWCGGDDGRASGTSYANWAPHQPATADCEPAAWGGRDYWFCHDGETWNHAEGACDAAGMTLAQVHDASENAFIRSRISGPGWLGATDAPEPGTWRWLEADSVFWSGGRSGSAVGGAYTNWSPGHPSNGASDCLSIHPGSRGYWHSEPCDSGREWVCSGPHEPARQVPDVRDCAVIRDDNGRWKNVKCEDPSGYVCESFAPDDTKTLEELAQYVRGDYRSFKPRVSHVTFRNDASVTDPFSRFGERLGLRECEDSIEPSGIPRPVRYLGLEAQDYKQAYGGIPVHTRGYTVLRDPVTKAVRSYTGVFEHDIVADITPQLSENQAFELAATAAGTRARDYAPPRPKGELVLFPAQQGPHPVWELTWLFVLPPPPAHDGFTVAVSARDGRTILASPWARRQCSSVDKNAGILEPS